MNIKKELSKIKKIKKIYGETIKIKDNILSSSMFILKKGNNIDEIKNIHMNKRCFILGNGPSLTPKDLEKLVGEITFSSNRIYNIFDQTYWRPKYYCAFDHGFVKDKKNINKIIELECDKKFLRRESYWYTRRIEDNSYFFKTKGSRKYLEQPKFTEDVSKQLYTIGTVTYSAIQIAVYMGIKEIYLLGVDNQYAKERTKDGKLIYNEGVKSYFTKEDIANEGFSGTYEMDIAYECAKEYCENHGIKIYNATRGGRLEIFERVNFDELFKDNQK